MTHAYTDEKVATVQTDFRGFEVMSQVLKVMSLVTLSPEILILYLKLFLSCQSSATKGTKEVGKAAVKGS